jgi:hypothetical protein
VQRHTLPQIIGFLKPLQRAATNLAELHGTQLTEG